MSTQIQIINTIAPVVLMLMIGMACRKYGILTREGINGLKSVVVNITLSAVLINAFATMDYSLNTIVLAVTMFVVCILAWIGGRIWGRLIPAKSRFIPFLTTGFEAGMLGYSLYILLYGSENIANFACIDLGQVLFVFTLYKIFLGLDGREKPTAKQLASEMMHSPTIIAILVGVLLGATGIYHAMEPSGVNTILDACTNFVSAPTSAIILLAIGYDLVFQDIPWKAVGMVTIGRLVIMLVLRIAAGLIVRALGLGSSLDAALNVMFILPPPYVLPVFADDEKQRAYVSSSLSVTTLITIIGFIVLAVAGI